MPYITSDKVKSIRKAIKDKYPKFKFSITRENHSGVRICLMESNIDFRPIINDARGCFQINQWSIKSTFEGNPRAIKMWEDIYKIADEGNYTVVEDGDYGKVPSFYVWLEVGKWDKPYIYTVVTKIKVENATVTSHNEPVRMVCSNSFPEKSKSTPVYTTKLFSEFSNDLIAL